MHTFAQMGKILAVQVFVNGGKSHVDRFGSHLQLLGNLYYVAMDFFGEVIFGNLRGVIAMMAAGGGAGRGDRSGLLQNGFTLKVSHAFWLTPTM